MPRRLRILTPAIESPELLSMVAYIAAQANDDRVVEHRFLDEGPGSVSSYIDEMVAGPGMIRAARQAEAEGADGIVVNCMCDPALFALREAVSIPVVGLAQSAMLAAAGLGQRFGFLDVLDSSRAQVADQVARYGLLSRFASFQAVNIPVLELEADPDRTLDGLVAASERAVRRDGADVLILGCGCFYACAGALERELAERGMPVPVINPIPFAIHYLDVLIQCGLRHSKLAFPTPN